MNKRSWFIGKCSARPSDGSCFIEESQKHWFVYDTDQEGTIKHDPYVELFVTISLHEAILWVKKNIPERE